MMPTNPRLPLSSMVADIPALQEWLEADSPEPNGVVSSPLPSDASQTVLFLLCPQEKAPEILRIAEAGGATAWRPNQTYQPERGIGFHLPRELSNS